jgi:uncharacterized protein with GYD domain
MPAPAGEGRLAMAFYLVRAKVAQDFMKALVVRPEDRFMVTTRLLKDLGGRLHYYFFSFGEYDIVLIYELPDNVTAASLAMVLNAAGTVTEVETTPLLTMEEAVEAMGRAGDTAGVYQPPGRSTKEKTGGRASVSA